MAERQHGLVTLPQLQSHGLGKAAVAKRAKDGRLHRVHRGVYAVGRPYLTEHGQWLAAVLAYGPRAVLSHRSAAGLLGIRRDSRAKADVSLPSPSARSRPGLRAVHDALDRAGRRRGAGVLRAVLERFDQPTLTRRGLEERFLGLCREASIPNPAVNTWITLDDGVAYQADFLWRTERVIVETDGRDVHTTAKAFEHDRLRDQRLTLAGFTVVRFTWRQVIRERDRVAQTVARLLARGRDTLLARLARP